MSLQILGWAPQPGKPLPIPRFLDDRKMFPEDQVRDLLAWMAVWLKDRAVGDEIKVGGRPWRIGELKCPLRDNQTGKQIAVHKFVCARPSIAQSTLIIVGGYIGTYRTAKLVTWN